MTKTEFIFFDLGNVITFFSHEVGCQRMAEVSGTTAVAVQNVLLDGPLQTDYETGRIDSREFHARFCQATGTTPGYEDLLRAGSDIFTLNTPVMPMITQLSAAGIPLGILSNTCPAHWDFVTQQITFLKKGMSRFVLSYQSGSMKPDAKIYADAIAAAACEPGSILFTDDRQENVDGAVAAGLDAVHFESAAQFHRELVARGIRINL